MLGWRFLVTACRAAGRRGRQRLSGGGSDPGSDSGSGAWDRPGSHWLGGSIWASAGPHKGARPLAHPPIPSSPRHALAAARPALAPGRLLPLRPPAGLRYVPAPGGGGNATGPVERVSSSRGATSWLGPVASQRRPCPVPQGSRSLSLATGTVWSCPRTRYVCHCRLTAVRGGQVGQRRERWETRLVCGREMRQEIGYGPPNLIKYPGGW